jgi:hypothetical protein
VFDAGNQIVRLFPRSHRKKTKNPRLHFPLVHHTSTYFDMVYIGPHFHPMVSEERKCTCSPEPISFAMGSRIWSHDIHWLHWTLGRTQETRDVLMT